VCQPVGQLRPRTTVHGQAAPDGVGSGGRTARLAGQQAATAWRPAVRQRGIPSAAVGRGRREGGDGY
jgi:hypothetical protein